MKLMDIEKHRQLEQLEQKLLKPLSPLHVDSLLDAVEALVSDCDTPCGRKLKNINNFLKRYENDSKKIRDCRVKIDDFDILKLIGRGAYGEVKVVRQKSTKNIYAMKQLSKYEVSKKPDNSFFWEEREVMALTKSDWMVQLHHAFQDRNNLYMVMDYMPGGDLVSLMMNWEISEEWGKFYAAEMVLALDAIHEMGFIHRDVKPENMLIDREGHIKLADFGTSKRMDSQGYVKSETPVGTPEYISPEVLRSQEGKDLCGRECDFWGVGVILYEMMFDNTPFCSDSLAGLYGKIMTHDSSLEFPVDIQISCDAKDIIRKFLTSPEKRLGRNGINEIKAHAFFENEEYSFETIRQAKAPFVPELKGADDTCYFEDVRRNENSNCNFPTPSTFEGNQLPFIGFTYSREFGVFTGKDLGKQSTITKNDHETPCDDISKLKSCLENERIRSKELEEKYANAVKQLEDAEKQTKKPPKLDLTNLQQSLVSRSPFTKDNSGQMWGDDCLEELKIKLTERFKSQTNVLQDNINVNSMMDVIKSTIWTMAVNSTSNDGLASPSVLTPDLATYLQTPRKSYADVLKTPSGEGPTKLQELTSEDRTPKRRGNTDASMQTESHDTEERISTPSTKCMSAHGTDSSHTNLMERLQKLERDLEEERQKVFTLNSQICEDSLARDSLQTQLHSVLSDAAEKDSKLTSTQKELAQIKSGSEVLEQEVQELKTAKNNYEDEMEELNEVLECQMYSIQLYKTQLGEKIGEAEKYQQEVSNLTEERDNLNRKLQFVMESAESEALSLAVATEVIMELQKADPKNSRLIDELIERERDKELAHMNLTRKNNSRRH